MPNNVQMITRPQFWHFYPKTKYTEFALHVKTKKSGITNKKKILSGKTLTTVTILFKTARQFSSSSFSFLFSLTSAEFSFFVNAMDEGLSGNSRVNV